MATNQQPRGNDDELPLPPPLNDATREALRAMPGVIVHRRDPAKTGWTFEPIAACDGYDINAAIERAQAEEDRELLNTLFRER
jgi:hypothetical protein